MLERDPAHLTEGNIPVVIFRCKTFDHSDSSIVWIMFSEKRLHGNENISKNEVKATLRGFSDQHYVRFFHGNRKETQSLIFFDSRIVSHGKFHYYKAFHPFRNYQSNRNKPLFFLDTWEAILTTSAENFLHKVKTFFFENFPIKIAKYFSLGKQTAFLTKSAPNFSLKVRK